MYFNSNGSLFVQNMSHEFLSISSFLILSKLNICTSNGTAIVKFEKSTLNSNIYFHIHFDLENECYCQARVLVLVRTQKKGPELTL